MPDTPFCLGILGDFSASSNIGSGEQPPKTGPPSLHRLTPDNLLGLGGLATTLCLRGLEDSGKPLEIPLASMDDFHPDRLFQTLEIFEPFRVAQAEPLPLQDLDRAGSLLDRVLGEMESEPPLTDLVLSGDLDAFARRTIRPYVVPSGPDRSDARTALHAKAGSLMKRVLHHPDFQAHESLWRSVVFLLSSIEVSSGLRVYLVDVSKAGLSTDLLSSDEPAQWMLTHLFLDPISEHGERLRWGALIGSYPFGSDPEDIALLQRLGLLAETAQVPFLSAADSSLIGCPSLDENADPREWTRPVDPAWEPLRSNPEARWIGLAIPGFLARAAYGPEGEPTRTFDFDESPESASDLLWGNPALLLGIGLGRAFADEGWECSIGDPFQVGDLPVHVSPEGSARSLQAHWSQSAVEDIVRRGFSPIVAERNMAMFRIPVVRPISASGSRFRAWWSR